jgi:predicted lysophospholipase L1 biosynthesis ABC-type transport system permease subunit
MLYNLALPVIIVGSMVLSMVLIMSSLGVGSLQQPTFTSYVKWRFGVGPLSVSSSHTWTVYSSLVLSTNLLLCPGMLHIGYFDAPSTAPVFSRS